MSAPDAHESACSGLRRAVDHLERGDRRLAALEVLASTCVAAEATVAGELDPAQDAQIRRAAREILLAAVDDA